MGVDGVEDVACRLDRQCGDFRTLAVPGNGCNSGSDAEGHRFDLTQFIHYAVDLSGVYPMGVEDGLGVIEDYEHLPGREKRS